MSIGGTACVATGLAVLALAASSCGTKSGASVVRELGETKEQMDEVDREIAALRPPEPGAHAPREKWIRAVKRALRRYEPIEQRALALRNEAEDVRDVDLRRAAELLVRMIGHQRKGIAHLVAAAERGPVRVRIALLQTLALEDEAVEKMKEEWRLLAMRLSKRYATV